MSTSLEKPSSGSAARGLVPAVASGFVPGLGQLINGEGTKALGVFVVAFVTGAGLLSGLLTGIPLIGPLIGLAATLTWLYAVIDGYVTGRKKS
jgi:hypothetical protein